MLVKISEIKINPGRREAAPKAIEEMTKSIAAVGLINPITIDQDNTLIAGLHRLEAAKRLGWTEIECTVSNINGLQAELAEIDENFVRTNLSHRELGDLLLRRKELYEAIHLETRQGQRNGQTAKNDNLAFLETKPFSEDTAEKLGVSKRTVERLVQTAANLIPEAKKIIHDADEKITKGAALKISQLPPDQQEEAAMRLTTSPSPPRKQSLMDKKLAVKGPENWPPDSQKVSPQTARKLASNIIRNSNLKNNLGGVSERTHAVHGRYQNVFLSDTDIAELQTELPDLWQQYLERLSEYMASTGKTYQNHAATIRRWAAEDRGKGKGIPDYTYKEGESL